MTGNSDVTRRGFLKHSSAVAGVGLLQVDRLPKTEITVAERPDGPDTTVEVSKRWKRQVDKAIGAADEYKRRHLGRDDVASVGVAPGKDEIGRLRKPGVAVASPPSHAGPPADVPGRAKGVPVRREEMGPIEWSCDKTNHDPIPSGVQIATEKPNGDASAMSLGPIGYDDTGERFMLTAYHGFTNAGSPCPDVDVSGLRVGQPDPGSVVAEATSKDRVHDVAFLDPSDATVNEIHSEDSAVNGCVSTRGLAYLASTYQDDVKLSGRTSCVLSGKVEAANVSVDVSSGCDGSLVQEDLVKTTIDWGNGDSGGPVYWPDDAAHNYSDDSYIGHVSFGNDTYGWAVSAYAIKREVGGIWYGAD